MKKTRVNYFVDWTAFVLMFLLIGTGTILHFRLPPGSGGASLLGLTRHEWGDVHFWIAIGLVSVALLHLVLHLDWIKTLTAGAKDGAHRQLRIWGAIGAACLLVAGVISALLLPVSRGGQDERHEDSTERLDGRRGEGRRAGRAILTEDSEDHSGGGSVP